MNLEKGQEKYSAKTSYFKETSAVNYEKRKHYTGFLGNFRKHREKKIISEALDYLKEESDILDCPCGNGRWFGLLSQKAKLIIGRDISPAMIKAAGKTAQELSINTDIALGDAEDLSLSDSSVDYVFSFALMKHLPDSVKNKVLSEFSRVCKTGIVCSFAVFNKISYLQWKIRNKDPESYPIWKSDLIKMAEKFGLETVSIKRLTPFAGLECLLYFRKK